MLISEYTQLNLEYTQQLGVHSVELRVHLVELGVQSIELGVQSVELRMHSGFMLRYTQDKCRVEGPGAIKSTLKGFRIKFFIAGILLLKGSLYQGFSVLNYI
jgi:hypothetical protein